MTGKPDEHAMGRVERMFSYHVQENCCITYSLVALYNANDVIGIVNI